MGRVTCLCLLSIAFFCCNFADLLDLVTLYGAGFKHRPLRGKRRGRDLRSGHKRQYSVHLETTVTLQDALERLSSHQFSHYTVCLRSDANYSVSSQHLTEATIIKFSSAVDKLALLHCNNWQSRLDDYLLQS